MNAISKKLLSMLVVLAMVLSMVPFGGLSIFAVETEATQVASNTVTPGQANLPDGISTTNPVDNDKVAEYISAGNCPMCGITNGSANWTETTTVITVGTSENKHYYYALPEGKTEHTYSLSGTIIGMNNAQNSKVCVAIEEGVTLTTAGRGVWMQLSGNILNIMGKGTMLAGSGTGTGYGVFQLANGGGNDINLYGGHYLTNTYQSQGDSQTAVIRMISKGFTVNMYDGVTIGPETVETNAETGLPAKWGLNVHIKGGTFNMYGGTIRNGASKVRGISGNVTVVGTDAADYGTFNMYGGTIEGGKNQTGVGNIYGGNVIIGGKHADGTDKPYGKFNMYGGTVTGGKAQDGGNIFCLGANAVMNLQGGIVKDGSPSGQGGNIKIAAGTEHKIGGTALITNGVANWSGGNIDIVGGKLTMEGGYITGGEKAATKNAGTGGAVNVQGGATFEMTGGEISGCKTSSYGGNISVSAGTVTISGTAVVKDGTTVNHGANVFVSGTGKLNISGGTVAGGSTTAANSAYKANIYADAGMLNISGGTIVGNVATKTGDSTSITLSGAPEICTSKEIGGETVTADYGLSIVNNAGLDVSAVTGGNITVTGQLDWVFTAADNNAQTLANYFSVSDPTLDVAANDAGQLYIVEAVNAEEPEVGVFDPEACGGMAYCQACIDLGISEAKALVKWTPYTGQYSDTYVTTGDTSHGHYYLTGDLEYTGARAIGAYAPACFNLNGYSIAPAATNTSTSSTIDFTMQFNLFNTGAAATVWGNSLRTEYGCVARLHNANAKLNLFKKVTLKSNATAADDSPILSTYTNGGEINIRGGVIDARGLTVNGLAPAIMMYKGVVNMHSGTIYGGTSSTNGGAIQVGIGWADANYANVATFNMYGGTIDGGTANGTEGGGIFFVPGNNVNIYGGEIKNGSAPNGNGGIFYLKEIKDVPAKLNISQADSEIATTITGGSAKNGGIFQVGTDCELNISGGTITGGNASNFGGTFMVNGGELNISGGTVNGGTATNQGGIMRADTDAVITLSGNAILHSGTATNNPGIWLVNADLTMSGTSQVLSAADSTDAGSAIQAASGSTVILSGSATVKSASGESKNNLNLEYSATAPNQLLVDKNWTGEVYCRITADSTRFTNGHYQIGDILDNEDSGYCGTLADGTVTKDATATGTFTGKLYSGPRNNTPILGVNGDLVIAAASVVTKTGETSTTQWYATNQAAVDAAAGNNDAYVAIGKADEIELKGNTFIDSCGYNLTVTGTGELYALDSSNDDYSGYSKWTVIGPNVINDATNPVTGSRYIFVKDTNADTYGAHRIEIKLTAVTLRTTAAGLYYKASYKCDGTLAARISSYGVALNVNEVPTAESMVEANSKTKFSSLTDFDAKYDATEIANTVAATSCSVFNIFNADASNNAERGMVEIYANAYFEVDGEIIVMGDETNDGTTNGVGYSLYEALKAVNDGWNTLNLTAEKKQAVKDFCDAWAAEGVDWDWVNDFTNINSYGEA